MFRAYTVSCLHPNIGPFLGRCKHVTSPEIRLWLFHKMEEELKKTGFQTKIKKNNRFLKFV